MIHGARRVWVLPVLLSAACEWRDEANLGRYASETLVPGHGIGEITIGRTTLADVTKLFGETNAYEHFSDSSSHYYANGLTIVTRPAKDATGVVERIGAGENIYGTGRFLGRTDKGIGPGQSREDVLAAYGEPTKLGFRSRLYYERLRVTFALDDQGAVDEIWVQAPRTEGGATLRSTSPGRVLAPSPPLIDAPEVSGGGAPSEDQRKKALVQRFLEDTLLEDCEDQPAAVIRNVRVLFLSDAGITRASLLHPQQSIDRHNELTGRLPRLDVAAFCDCRIRRLRTELPKAALIDLLRIQQEVVEACLDENS